MKEPLTFNDIPTAMAMVLSKMEKLENSMDELHRDLDGIRNIKKSSNNIPMTIDEAAIYLDLKKDTIYKYVQNNKIPYHKQARKLWFFEHQLRKWVESHGKCVKHPLSEEEKKILNCTSGRRRPKLNFDI